MQEIDLGHIAPSALPAIHGGQNVDANDNIVSENTAYGDHEEVDEQDLAHDETRLLSGYPFTPTHLSASGTRFLKNFDSYDEQNIVNKIEELFGGLSSDAMAPGEDKEGQLTKVYSIGRSVQVYQKVSELRRHRQQR